MRIVDIFHNTMLNRAITTDFLGKHIGMEIQPIDKSERTS